ncbi:LTA synthase family protein [Alkalicoccus halolimnae]|uniref:LTA synthase family protein n=1 Tax=Alkalicoccus halolimnae TaxID=1667239 RepID=A0A5C7FHU3_9BACI|nr:LTA synthase family protein [Alkalicoccus halolimnae]TXF86877.1 LTA synthase family protein [Alkalicoccus halolimnae]
MRDFLSRHRFMLFCLTVLWIKTVVVSFLTFDLVMNHWSEMVIFIINPLAFLLLIFGAGLLLKPSWQRPYFFIISAVLSTILYSNTVYYREFADIITLPMLVMSGNAGDLTTSVFELIQWWDIVFFLDLVFIGYFAVKKPEVLSVKKEKFWTSKLTYAWIATVAVSIILVSQVEVEEPEAPAHSFDRENLVKSLGIYNFYFYDVYLHFTTGAQSAFAEREDLDDIKQHLETYQIDPNADYFAEAEGKNVVVLSLESFETFVIGETINGDEITPFLNDLIEDSFYFDNIYDQAGQGKTSDTEFMVNNSLYPLGRGAVFHTHPENELTPLPRALGEKGYYNAAFHANVDTFYNRGEVYPHLGYDHYYDIDAYDISDENSVGWGLKDIEFMEQSMDYFEEIPQPFYSTMLTLTNHFPYELDEEDTYVDEADTESDIVNRYFPTVRYTDEAVRVLFDEFKEAGMYEDTIFVIYGDHYGLAESHYEELEEFLESPIGPYETVKLDRIPVIIHAPGMEDQAETISTVGGHIDIMPTLVNLLGMNQEEHVMFGSDLLSEDRDDFAVLRSGNVVTDEVVFTGEFCFDAESGEELNMEACLEAAERGEDELYYSDQIIYGDLLRFFEAG